MTNRLKNSPEPSVVFLLQFFELPGQLLVPDKNFSQPDEGAHYRDVDVDGVGLRTCWGRRVFGFAVISRLLSYPLFLKGNPLTEYS